ncbi:MAG: hypothetical protein AB1410_07745 [Acidobacteriota bacterium]
MKIQYSQHIENRLLLRKLDYELPKRIFDQSKERYIDEKTGHFIVIMKVEVYNKMREVMLAYKLEEDCAVLLTIHPLKEGQKEKRIATGRWRKV